MENIVKVYITDISNKSLQPQKYDLLEVNRKENIITAKNYLYRLRSMCAGLLLRHALISEGCEVNGVLDVKYTDKGKPYIENGKKFSISHSGNIVIVAVSDFEVGVDAEICQNKVYSHIASKVLSPNEFIEYDKLVGVDKITYFYDLGKGQTT